MLALLLVLRLSTQAAMLKFDAEGPAGHASCSNGLDDNEDGLVDSADSGCAKANALTPCAGGWCAKAEDGVLWGTAEVFADSASPGNAVRLQAGATYGTGGVRFCGANFNVNPGYMQLYTRSAAAASWIKQGTTHGQTMDTANDTMLVPANPAYAWSFTNRAASVRSRTLAADQLPYNLSGTGQRCWDIALDETTVIYATFVAASVTTPPVLPSPVGGTPTPSYTILRVNSLNESAMDGTCSQGDWSGANQLAFTGVNQLAGDATGRLTFKAMLWKPGPPMRLCACVKTDDTDRRFATTTNDDPTMFTIPNDRLEVLTDSSLSAVSAGFTTVKVALNANTVHYDANYPSGSAATSYTTNLAKAVLHDGAHINYELCWDLGANQVGGDLIKLNMLLTDQDNQAAVAQASGLINEFGDLTKALLAQLSNTQTVPPDTVAPTLTACTTVGTPDVSTATVRCTVSEPSQCWVEADNQVDSTIGGGTLFTTAAVASQSGQCMVGLSFLKSNTPYEWRMKARDPAGNVGPGSAISTFTTSGGATGCNYYVSNNGTGSGTSQDSPTTFANIWNLEQSTLQGKVICALNGTYQGSNNMIRPLSGMSGTPDRPITVKALNDGGAFIDGQMQRVPFYLSQSSYWIVEGFNIANSRDCAWSGGGEQGTVVLLGTGSNNNIIRRVVAWNAARDINDAMVFGSHHNSNNLFEDVAGFGTGRKIFDCAQGGNNCTYRRIWARWEGSINVGPKLTAEHIYNNTNMTIENALLTWRAEKMPSSYALQNGCVPSSNPPKNLTGIDQPYASLGGGGDSAGNVNNKVFGSIVYQVGTEPPSPLYNVFYPQQVRVSGILLQDVVSYVPPNRDGQYAFHLGPMAGDVTASKITSIGGKHLIHPVWSLSNVVRQPTLDGLNIWTTSSGGNICNRYINGVRQSTPLWPWPMRQRIIDAMIQAGYSNPVDVDTEIQAIFGQIPSQCRPQ
jgi:hypothetical protein